MEVLMNSDELLVNYSYCNKINENCMVTYECSFFPS